MSLALINDQSSSIKCFPFIDEPDLFKSENDQNGYTQEPLEIGRQTVNRIMFVKYAGRSGSLKIDDLRLFIQYRYNLIKSDAEYYAERCSASVGIGERWVVFPGIIHSVI